MLAVPSHITTVLVLGRGFHKDFCNCFGTEVRVVILLFPRCFLFTFLKVIAYICIFLEASTDDHYSSDEIGRDLLPSGIYASRLDP